MNKFSKLKSFFLKDTELLKKIFFTTLSRGAAAGGTFVFNFILAKFLDIDDFGHFMLAYTILVGLSIVSRFGMGTAVLRFAGVLYENKNPGQLKKLNVDALKLNLLLSITLSICLLLFKKTLANYFFDGELVDSLLTVIAIVIPFYSYIGLQSAFMKAYKKPQWAALFEIGIVNFFTGSIVLCLALVGLEITKEIASVILLLSCVAVVFVGSEYVKRILRKSTMTSKVIQVETNTNFFRTLPDYALSSIIDYSVKFTPTLFLGYFASSSDVGLYSLANRIAIVISFILWIINSVYAPYFANLYENGDKIKLQQMVKNSMLYMILIATPLFLIILIFSTQILGYFGSAYKDASFALILLGTGQYINVLTGPVVFLLNMTGLQKKIRNIVILTGALSIISSLIFIPIYGIMGAVFSTVIGLVIQNLLALYITKRDLEISIF